MKRNIYIARRHDGHTLGIVLAEDERIAHAYFVGGGTIPHAMGTIDPEDERLGILGLVCLFKTQEVQWGDMADRASRRRGTRSDPLLLEDLS